MGCDIHMFCEESVVINGSRLWVSADHFELNPYYRKDGWDDEREYNLVELFGDRNYFMFTSLCGVRDYTELSPKISEPRGVPDDATELVKRECDEIDCDGHSHSFVTLRDVKRFIDLNEPVEPVKVTGLISQKQAEDLDYCNVKPDSWCQGTSDKTYVRRSWERTGENPLQGLYIAMCKRFRKYYPNDIDEKDMDDFRIVFWFDN